MKCFGVVYKIINTVDGKIYIGQTINLVNRKNAHINAAKNGKDCYLYNAIRKYGIDVFITEIVIKCNNRNELDTFEQYYIKKFNTFNRSHGYNLTFGGGGCSGFVQTKNTIRLRTKKNNKVVFQYDLNGNFIKSWKSIRYVADKLNLDRPSISNCCNGKRFKQVGGFIWRLKINGFNKNLDINLVKNDGFKAKIVLQYSLEGDFIKEYSSVYSAKKVTGVGESLILNNCEGRTRLPKKFIWRYKNNPLIKEQVPKYIKRVPSKENIDKLKKSVSKVTMQYNLKGDFIKEFSSVVNAANSIGVHPDNIYKVCRGQRKTSGGFKWRYK